MIWKILPVSKLSAPRYGEGDVTAPLQAAPLRDVKPSARVKLAAMLYVTGACPTKKAASTAAGLHPNYLTMLTSPNNGSSATLALLDELTRELQDKTIDMSVVMNRLGRLGLSKLAQLAIGGSNERIQLDAAKTLADRSPETAGIQKVQVDALTLGTADAQAIAAALVESARLSQDFEKVAIEGLVELDVTQGAKDVGDTGIAFTEAATGPAPEETSVRLLKLVKEES